MKTLQLPLLRPRAGRIFAGVCRGLALHLNVPVAAVRWFFALTSVFGVGVLLYAWFWLMVPAGNPLDQHALTRPATLQRLVPALTRPETERSNFTLFLGVGFVVLAGLFLLYWLGVVHFSLWWFPLVLVLGGLVLAWSQIEVLFRSQSGGTQGQDSRDGSHTRENKRLGTWARIAGGALIGVAGLAMFTWNQTSLTGTVQAVIATLVIGLGVSVILAPLGFRFYQQLMEERRAHFVAAERADIAAHLHDSVLQTLVLIRANADDATQVKRLALAQENELREWLYRDRNPGSGTLAHVLRTAKVQLEAEFGIEVGLVIVGDIALDASTEALGLATVEAARNALRHGTPPIGIYAELGKYCEVFVRDNGPGFDLESIPRDRLGIRGSIVGRMQRHGGEVEVHTAPGRSTEVALSLRVIDRQEQT